MQHTGEENLTLRRYLSGELSGEELERVEKRLLTDDNYFAKMEEMEEDFIDNQVFDQAAGNLFADFAADAQVREEVRLAGALKNYAELKKKLPPLGAAAQASSPAGLFPALTRFFQARIPVPGYALFAASVLVIAGASMLGLKVWQQGGQLQEARRQNQGAQPTVQELREQLAQEIARRGEIAEELEREREQRLKLQQELAALTPPKKEENQPEDKSLVPRVAAQLMTLAPGRTRGGATRGKNLLVGPEAAPVTFQLILIDEYPRYRVELRTGGGKAIWNANSLEPRTVNARKALVFTLSSSLLSDGDYYFSLSGVGGQAEPDAPRNYYFKVTSK
ncbi:MAG TPA: hypothetical protein VNI02_04990 [Blastocatellia bacterium]|jgi:hypothetical protein|nr:hypothetical protein [Blastocatellia bacterium]